MFSLSLGSSSLTFLLVVGLALGEKKCFDDQYLNKRGKCRNCPFCLPGEGMNFTAQVSVTSDGDPLECHPCITCHSGYYNDPAAGQYGCSQCRLNCRLMNRKVYEECGGTNSGKCGACLDSSYEDRENNLDSPCYKRSGVEITGIKLAEVNDKVVDENTGSQRSNSDNNTATKTPKNAAIVLGVCLPVLALVFSAVGFVKFKKTRDARLALSQSGTHLAASTTTFGHDNSGWGSKYEKISLDEENLETDGIQPHHEIEELKSSGPAALQESKEEDLKKTRQTKRTYPKHVVETNDKYFNYLTKHLYGRQVRKIFQKLGVRDQTIFSELDHYENDRKSYEEVIYNLLLKWVRLKARDATLSDLCPVLEKFGLNDLSKNLIYLAETDGSTTGGDALQNDKHTREAQLKSMTSKDTRSDENELIVNMDEVAKDFTDHNVLRHTYRKDDNKDDFRRFSHEENSDESAKQKDKSKFNEQNMETKDNLDSLSLSLKSFDADIEMI